MCDMPDIKTKKKTIDQHAANLLCQSLNRGFSKAKSEKDMGWFNQGEFSRKLFTSIVSLIIVI